MSRIIQYTADDEEPAVYPRKKLSKMRTSY